MLAYGILLEFDAPSCCCAIHGELIPVPFTVTLPLARSRWVPGDGIDSLSFPHALFSSEARVSERESARRDNLTKCEFFSTEGANFVSWAQSCISS
jgi:hypothetical protein